MLSALTPVSTCSGVPASCQQQRDQCQAHATRMRVLDESIVDRADAQRGFAACKQRRYGPLRRRNRRFPAASIERETTWSTFSTKSRRNSAPNARSNC